MTEHARPPTPRVVRLALGLAVFAVLIVAGFIIYLAVWGNGESQQKEVAQQGQVQEQAEKKDLAAEVDRICATKTAEATSLRKRGKCEQAKEIIHEPVAGPAGPQGAGGPPGPPGPPGKDGVDGQSPPCLLELNRCVGARGLVGASGPIGPQGPMGPQGKPGESVKGDTGDKGDVGPKGDTGDASTVPGPKGDQGDKGDVGQSAYPFEFDFTVPGVTPNKYHCVVSAPGTPGVCQQVEQP